MFVVLKLLMIMSLLTIIVQDFKSRTVSVFVLILNAICLLCLGVISKTITIQEFLINTVFITLLLLSVKVYLLIRTRSISTSIGTGLGMADIILFFSLAFYLKPIEFALVLISAFVSAFIASLFIKTIREQIPLASFLSINFLFYFGIIVFS